MWSGRARSFAIRGRTGLHPYRCFTAEMQDIFLNNRETVLEMLGRFTEDLTALQRAIRWGEGDKLFAWFTGPGPSAKVSSTCVKPAASIPLNRRMIRWIEENRQFREFDRSEIEATACALTGTVRTRRPSVSEVFANKFSVTAKPAEYPGEVAPRPVLPALLRNREYRRSARQVAAVPDRAIVPLARRSRAPPVKFTNEPQLYHRFGAISKPPLSVYAVAGRHRLGHGIRDRVTENGAFTVAVLMLGITDFKWLRMRVRRLLRTPDIREDDRRHDDLARSQAHFLQDD